MKYVKINTVRQNTEDGKFQIYKSFDRCFTIISLTGEVKIAETFERLKDAKAYLEKNFYQN